MKYQAPRDLSLLEALAEMSPESSKTTLRSWLKDGRISVNGASEKIGSRKIKKGQWVEVGRKLPVIGDNIRVLYEDNYIVVIEKPQGLLSVAADFDTKNTAHAFLKANYRPRKVYVVHRLDQETSGVMVFALTHEAYENLKKMFEKHEMERSYIAIVEGKIEEPSGTWESLLYEDENYVVHVSNDPARGVRAVTHYEVENCTKRLTRLRLTLETGRKNQIRVHCQAAGHSVVGDKKYGASINPIKRLCLHASLLAFPHPITQKPMRFISPVPKIFDSLIQPGE